MVKLDESVIKAMCYKASEIFMSQPMLLELEAPLKICGKCVVLITSWSFLSAHLSIYIISFVLSLYYHVHFDRSLLD